MRTAASLTVLRGWSRPGWQSRRCLTDRTYTCRICDVAVAPPAGPRRLTFWQTDGMLGSDGRKRLSLGKRVRIQQVEALFCNVDESGSQRYAAMATDIGVILQNLLSFFDFSGRSVLAVGAGGGQFAEYARSMKKVLAVDRDLAAMKQLQEAAARLDLQDRFEYWTGDFADCDRRGDVVLFEFCLHEMDDPSTAVAKATTLAPDVVVIDHAPGSPWVYFTAEDDKVDRSWRALDRMQVIRQCSYTAEQRFAIYDELHAKVKSQGDVSIRRIERFREQTNITIPMTYALALIMGTAG